MGFMKGGSLLIISIILLFATISFGLFFVLTSSLKYENVEKGFIEISDNLTEGKFNFVDEEFNLTEEINKISIPMSEHCKNNSEYLFSSGGYNFSLSCSSLNKTEENSNAIFEESVSNIIHSIYYKEYNCKFWKCVAKNKSFILGKNEENKTSSILENGGILVLISDKARIYWKEKFYYSLLILIILIGLATLLVEQKQNSLILVGALFLISSFLLLKIENLIKSLAGNYFLLVNLFFSKIGMVFRTMLILGVLLIILGISLKIVYRDSSKKKFSKKDVFQVIKEGLSSKNNEEIPQKDEKTSKKDSKN